MTALFLLAALFFADTLGITQPALLEDSPSDSLVITRRQDYQGSALYGFMNGGSDLFFEYGFQNLTVQQLSYKGSQLQVEYYVMDNQENTFGIYSIHCFNCRRHDVLSQNECSVPSCLQACSGNLYLNILDLKPKGNNSSLLDSLMHRILAIQKPSAPLPNLPVSGTDYFACGPLGLSQAAFHWSDMLENFENWKLWLHRSVAGQLVFSGELIFTDEKTADSFNTETVGRNNISIIRESPLIFRLEDLP